MVCTTGVGVTVGVAVGAGVYGAGVEVGNAVDASSATAIVAVGCGVGVGSNVMTWPQLAIVMIIIGNKMSTNLGSRQSRETARICVSTENI